MLLTVGCLMFPITAAPMLSPYHAGAGYQWPLVMMVGWIDDHRHVAARRRSLMHFAAATWAVYWLDGFPSINIGHMVLPLGWAGHFLAIVGIVWMINLYNFMDGIDGLAAG